MKKPLIAVVLTLGLIFVFSAIALRAPKTTITLSGARIELPTQGSSVLQVFVNIQNGELPDTLIGASSDFANSVTLISETPNVGLPIPANSSPVLSADGAFFALDGVDENLVEGQLIPISFEFETSGSMATRAIISKATDPHAAHRAMMASGTMNMELLDVGQETPTAEMTVSKTSDGAWAITLNVAHFTFDEGVEKPVHVPGHGHAHLYINGLKLQRMYSTDALIGTLPPGEYVVRASLNTNDHRPYLNDAGPVEAIAKIVVD